MLLALGDRQCENHASKPVCDINLIVELDFKEKIRPQLSEVITGPECNEKLNLICPERDSKQVTDKRILRILIAFELIH
jgi:hypothetical protein